ncbi:MAG TPA: WYL domain-containing protein, partial [Arenicellales bacterium]|nr:WYL domain-containing protein [Arenicellales bacterium]
MDRFDRVYELHRILASRRTPISRRELEERMECKRATVARTIEFLRDRLHAPIEYDRERNGYIYRQDEDGPWELPGLWFNAGELHALLSSHELLSRIQPGIFDEALRPALQRIEELLEQRHFGTRSLVDRVRILQTAPRPVDVQQFRRIAEALAERRRLHAFYHGRARDETTERDLSPQRLVYYRDNWYLDAWCHWREDLRTFSLDRLHVVDLRDETAVDIAEDELDRVLASAYGIFAGEPAHTAVLRFTPDAARWVGDEQWHPDQDLQISPDGSAELRVPYADPREIVGEILRYGPEVEVLAPATLRDAVAQRLEKALACY